MLQPTNWMLDSVWWSLLTRMEDTMLNGAHPVSRPRLLRDRRHPVRRHEAHRRGNDNGQECSLIPHGWLVVLKLWKLLRA